MKKQLLLTLFLSFLFISLFATHNQAGEIVFKQMEDNPLTIEASIITYTKIASLPADRDSLTICWSNGICETIHRANGPDTDNDGVGDGEPINDFTKMNIYTAQHTYPGVAVYYISVTDPNRNGGILNVDFPNSENSPFMLTAELQLFNPSIEAPNQSPIPLQPPIDFGFTGEPFMHSPNAFSIAGDSVAYELVTPLGVSNYQQVTEIGAGPNNNLTLNEETGLLIWDSPQVTGLYTIAYLVKFYRNGQKIGELIRDMQVEVEEGPGFAPEITMENISGNEEIILVELGDTVRLDVTIEDPDINQLLEVSATCGLFEFFDNQATFAVDVDGSTATATFQWIVREEHLREQPYQLVVRAADDTPGHEKSSLAVVRYKTAFIPTSINELMELEGFEIAPNPVKSGQSIWITLDEPTSWGSTYKIINTLGQVVERGINTSNEIGIGRLATGSYVLWIDGYRPTPFMVQ